MWLVALGWFLRVHLFGFPAALLFDEDHFVENARNYLTGAADRNDHPPLGKLWLALSMSVLGDHSIGWRAPALLFGAMTVVCSSLAARRLFPGKLSALLAATFLSGDGFLIAYSRVALLDGGLAAFAAASLLGATLRNPHCLVLVSGVASGLAVATKFSGVGALFAPLVSIALMSVSRRSKLLKAVLLVLIVVGVYAACFSFGLALTGRPSSVMTVLAETRRLVDHHAGLTDMHNAAASSWPTWILPVRPLILGTATKEGMLCVLTSLGNLALWWSACALALTTVVCLFRRGLRSFPVEWSTSASPGWTPWMVLEPFLFRSARGVLTVLCGAAAFLAPWILTRRDSYIYHFLPSYLFLLILLAGFVADIAERRPGRVVLFLVLVVLVAGIYAPLWSFVPVTDLSLRVRLFLGSWR